MDLADVANNLALEEATHVLNHMRRSFVRMVPNGECRYCEDTVVEDHLFCDLWCRDQFESEQKQLRQLGRKSIRV